MSNAPTGFDTDLFGDYVDRWRHEWVGMPEYEQDILLPWRSVAVRFRSRDDLQRFEAAVGRTDGGLGPTRWCWYPPQEPTNWTTKVWVGGPAETRYPIYIISKGRAKSRLTARALERAGIPYRIVVEPHEYDDYAAETGSDGPGGTVLCLPFSNLGQGSIPARNWVWNDSVMRGDARHWILDDNIRTFRRLWKNTKHHVYSAGMFRAAEDFVDRYTNVALAGFDYTWATNRREGHPPYLQNARIYSCLLIDHNFGQRWRGRYNEDTDLSLRALKAGWATVLFKAFLIDKTATMTMTGGNSDDLYAGDGRLQMAQSLVDQHPDVARVSWKWGRFQHHVDYSAFRGIQLQPRHGTQPPEENNEYGMYLEDVAT